MRWKVTLPAKFSLFVAIALAVAICSSPVTFAASTQPNDSNPLVDVVVDATPAGCTITRTRVVVNSASTITHVPCRPYTLAKSVTMTRSEAIAKQLQYVSRPSQQADASAWRQETQALSQIVASQRSAYASQAQPLSCAWGGTWSQDEGWPTINGDNLDLSISWFTSSDCRNVYLQTAVIRGITSPNALYLIHISYHACCPYPTWTPNIFVGTNTITKHLPGNTAPYAVGNIFEYTFSDQSLQGGLGNAYWYDLGPLN